MATTYELKICGKVQHVGFRDRIEDIGRGLGIDGVVYNYEDGTVRILANFDDEEMKDFFKKSIKFLEKKDSLIKIEEIEEKELNSYIEFPKGINRISADDLLELNKKLDEGVKYIKLIFGQMELMNEKLDRIIELLENKN
jgi:acylphosphatase